MDKYKFTIEDTVVSNPDGWKNFELRLKRDDDIAGLLVSSTNKFTFSGNGYDAIKTRFDLNYNDKLNAKIEVLEDTSYVEKYKGVIILTDVLFNLEKRTAQTTIEDASFQGAIQSNKNVKAFINSGITKNSVEVAIIEVFNLDYFNKTGVYQTLANRRAYLLKDALDFLVRFMTDDEVKGVQSAYLDDTDNFDGYLPYITTGEAIRVPESDAPNVSFVDIMTFLQRTHDLTFDFVTVSGDIVMRIEERAFFFQSSTIDTFRELTDLTVNIDAQRIASHLEIGNTTTAESGNCSLTARFFTFQQEDYALLGKGNVDKLLDLTTKFVTDSNVIEYIVANLSEDDYDDEIVIVQVEDAGASGFRAHKFLNTDYCTDFYYNASFTNDKIIDRNLNAIPNSITKYLKAATTPAKIGVLNNYTLFGGSPANQFFRDYVQFDDETTPYYDLGNRFTATTTPVPPYNYLTPFGAIYSFSYRVFLKIDAVLDTQTTVIKPHIDYIITSSLKRVDANLNFIEEQKKITNARSDENNILRNDDGIEFLNNTLILEDATNFDCGINDRIYLFIGIFMTWKDADSFTMEVLSNEDTNFMCGGAQTDAGIYKVFKPNDFKARLYKFQKNVSLQRTDNIRNNSRSSVTINELSDTSLDKTVWIEEMVNNVETSETSFTMIN